MSYLLFAYISMPVSRLFVSIEGDTSRLNASLQEAIKIAQDAGVQITRTGPSIIAAFDEAQKS